LENKEEILRKTSCETKTTPPELKLLASINDFIISLWNEILCNREEKNIRSKITKMK
jgi:hypothetical protein